MMRSSRHKSSKHGSKEGRDYLDSEKDYSVKKGREESGGSRKETVSRENRKMGLGSIEERDDFGGIVNVIDDDDEYGGSSSKKRKQMVDDNRWLGGKDEQKAIKNEGGSRSNKSRREWDAETVESKGESKHHRSERKDKGEKEARVEGERKGKGLAKSERLVNGEGSRNVKLDEDRAVKPLTGSDNQDDVRKYGYEKEHERRVRRKRGSMGDGDMHQDDIHDLRVSSRDQFSKSGKRKDEISTEKYPEDLDKVNKHADEKLAEGRHPRDYAGTRSHDKYLRNESKKLKVQQKKLKSYDSDSDREKISQNCQRETDDRDHDPDHDRRHDRVSDARDHEHEGDRDRDCERGDRDYELDCGRDRDYELDCGRDRDYEQDRGRDRDYEQDRGRDRDYERDRGCDRDRDYERDRGLDRDHDYKLGRDYERDRGRDRDYECDRGRDRDYERESGRDRRQGYERHGLDQDQGRNDRDHDLDRNHYRRERDRDPYDDGRDRGRGDHDYTSHLNSRSSSYKEDARKRLSPEYHDDHPNVKSRSDKFDDYYKEKHTSGKMNDNQNLKSRNAKVDEDRDGQRSLHPKGLSDNITGGNRGLPSPSSKSCTAIEEYRDATREERKHYGSERDVMLASEAHNEAPQYHPAEKRVKVNSSHSADLVMERTPPRKVSPNGFKNRSPSTGMDRRFLNRTGRRLSLDGDEVDRSSGSNNVRDGSANEDVLRKDLSSKEYLQSESSFRHRSTQGNASSHISGPLRRGADSPFLGSIWEENRGHTPSLYRSVDPNIPRAHGNQWKGVPAWPSPLPNGFMPFPPGPIGPPAGSFPGMIPPPFPPPPIFGLRPPMDMGHPGIPYISNADGFPMGPVRPFGWPNMVDAPGPPFHGWDADNGVLRDGSSMFGPAHFPNGRARGANADICTQNGDVNMTDPGPGSQNFENKLKASVNEASSKTESQGSRGENDYAEDLGKSVTLNALSGFEPSKEAPPAPTNLALVKSPETPAADNCANYLRLYLSKLDISAELADLELYNQCKSLEAEMRHEAVDEYATELALLEESLVACSEVSDPCYGILLFPAVEDSIFQRVLDLYNSQTNKSLPVVALLKNLHAPPLDMDCIEQISALHNKTEKQLLPIDQEIEEQPDVAADSITQLASTTPDAEVHGAPSPTVDLAKDVSLRSLGLETQDPASQIPTSPVPDITDAGIIDRLPCPETTENSHPLFHGESSPGFSNIPNSVEDMNTIVKEGGGEDTRCFLDQVGGGGSGSLCLHNNSVDSEVLESESVVLTRIHHPAEITH